MKYKTLRNSLSLVLLLALSCSSARSKALVGEEPQVTVSVYNDAGIPAGILLQAEREASRIFRQSGIEIRWLNCPLPPGGPEDQTQCRTADFPQHLQLRIAKRSFNLNEFAMGISYLSADGTGCYADLFFDRAKLIHESSHVDLATILGHAVAHELGHLLLGTDSHAPTGLMRAQWQPADLASASKGSLLFSTRESLEMRNKLAVWRAHAKNDSPVAMAWRGD